MDRINRLIIDSSQTVSDLCVLGAQYPTDKSPYHWIEGQDVPRHCYTPVYDLLFSARRYEPIVLGEVGVATNMSLHVWRSYFPDATLYGFDCFPHVIENARSHGLRNTYYVSANMNNPNSLYDGLNETRQRFDVLIDDSTHAFEHQIWFVEVGLHFVKSGGVMVVEDIFQGWPETRYHESLQKFFRYFSSACFIEMRHPNLNCVTTEEPYYNNDKLLVLFRNQEPAPRRHEPLVADSKLLREALALSPSAA